MARQWIQRCQRSSLAPDDDRSTVELPFFIKGCDRWDEWTQSPLFSFRDQRWHECTVQDNDLRCHGRLRHRCQVWNSLAMASVRDTRCAVSRAFVTMAKQQSRYESSIEYRSTCLYPQQSSQAEHVSIMVFGSKRERIEPFSVVFSPPRLFRRSQSKISLSVRRFFESSQCFVPTSICHWLRWRTAIFSSRGSKRNESKRRTIYTRSEQRRRQRKKRRRLVHLLGIIDANDRRCSSSHLLDQLGMVNQRRVDDRMNTWLASRNTKLDPVAKEARRSPVGRRTTVSDASKTHSFDSRWLRL